MIKRRNSIEMMKIKQEDGLTFVEIFAIMVIMGGLGAVVVSMFF